MKLVELQFAVHKNDEVGLKQNQLTQKPLHDQMLLGEVASRTLDKQRQAPQTTEATQHASIRDEEKQHHKRQIANKAAKTSSSLIDPESESIKRSEHPYKGQHIDLSL